MDTHVGKQLIRYMKNTIIQVRLKCNESFVYMNFIVVRAEFYLG